MVSEEEEIIEEEKESAEINDDSFIDILKIFSPGTVMRTALDDLLRARMGALIVVDKDGVSSIIEGGFKINCKFSAQRLVELAKMDGAIILSEDLKKILYSNVLIAPKMGLKTSETGTRHKAAERTAKQFKTLVVAVSERKNKTTIYWGDYKYVLDTSSEILRRATESLQILEKEKEIFDDLLVKLNILEITDLTSTNDVCNVLQRMEIIKRITDSIRKYLVELGKEGIIVSMRLRELTKDINSEREMILKDYFGQDYNRVDSLLGSLDFDFLLETPNILRIIFEELHDKPVYPRGIRILSKAGILEKDIDLLIGNYNTLDKIFSSETESLSSVLGKRNIESFRRELDSLKEKILEGKRV